MPWCDDCDRFWNPNTLRADGSCPTCGRVVAKARAGGGGAGGGGGGGGAAATAEDEELKAPWHFKLLVGGVVAYLGWRLVQAADWVLQRV